jgi:hypothetical protein
MLGITSIDGLGKVSRSGSLSEHSSGRCGSKTQFSAAQADQRNLEARDGFADD